MPGEPAGRPREDSPGPWQRSAADGERTGRRSTEEGVAQAGFRVADLEELDIEVEGGAGRHQPSALLAICEFRWRYNVGALAEAHPGDTLVPGPDDGADAYDEGERPATCTGAVEDCAVGELACVVTADHVSVLWLFARLSSPVNHAQGMITHTHH